MIRTDVVIGGLIDYYSVSYTTILLKNNEYGLDEKELAKKPHKIQNLIRDDFADRGIVDKSITVDVPLDLVSALNEFYKVNNVRAVHDIHFVDKNTAIVTYEIYNIPRAS